MNEPKASFSADWLAARERFDHTARDRAWPVFAERIQTLLPGIRRIVDLGCGTGSNLRYLSRRLFELAPAGQRQALLIDADSSLLMVARRCHRTAPAGISNIEYQQTNLAGAPDWPALQPGDLVSASALVDLVSLAWLGDLLDRCRRANAVVLLALSYDGRSNWLPAHPLDREVVRLFNLDQQSDKGLGSALGPAAAATASSLLERLGYGVWQARSDWQLDTRHASARRVVSALISDHARIAVQAQSESAEHFEQWAATRQRQLRTGRLRVRIGHLDVLAAPMA